MSAKEIDPPPQSQSLPGSEKEMSPQPETIREDYRAGGKLRGRKALITGGDSGIGRSVAVHFAAEGADVFFGYLNEDEDAAETVRLAKEYSRRCDCLAGDLGDPKEAAKLVAAAVEHLGSLDILVLNAAEQHPESDPEDIDLEQFEQTFRTNVHGYFHVLKEALPKMGEGSAILLTTSVTAFRGSGHLIDYSSTKGAILAMTRSLAQNLGKRNIRVNAVAPGPVWTPLIPATFPPDKVAEFGQQSLMGRPAQPSEVGPAYVFLASEDASYITGHTLHVNGGDYVD